MPENKKWMDDRQTNKPPRLRCDDEEEQKLGTALQGIRLRLLNPYLQLESEEEKYNLKMNILNYRKSYKL